MICPSILSADFSSLKEILAQMEEKGIQTVHFDVMDNHFVPNLTFGAKLIADLRPHSRLFFDAHLMIDSPEKDLDLYLDAGSDLITVHYESSSLEELRRMSQKVRSRGKKFGISIKPKTDPEVLEPLIPFMDLLLIMTVEPGFGGQKMIPQCLEKISRFRKLAAPHGHEILVQTDGGINRETFLQALAAGTQWFVVGSAFFKEPDFGFYPQLLQEALHAPG